jgi:hypothetical protein
MSWDDDEENTSVFAEEREEARRRKRSLLSDRPPPSVGLQAAATDRPTSPGLRQARAADLRRLGLVTAGLLGVAALLVFLLLPKTGTIVVTVAGPGDIAVDGVRVFVDEVERCPNSPCRIEKLTEGVHIVRATAPGYASMAAKPIEVEAGEERPVALVLSRGGEGGVTGLKVPQLGQYLRLSLNGEDRGQLPVTLRDLQPGTYAVRISGNERYAVYEDNVTIQAGQTLTLQPKLKVLRGRAKLREGPGAAGAQVMVECPGADNLIVQLPTSVDVPVDKPCTLSAKRPGYRELRELLSFDEGNAEKTFTVTLSKAAQVAGDESAKGKGRAQDRPDQAVTPTASGDGTIRISSTPPATALVDGRPVGRTPTSTKVPPGAHSVVFMHPEHGKKVVKVRVTAGGTANAAVKFP